MVIRGCYVERIQWVNQNLPAQLSDFLLCDLGCERSHIVVVQNLSYSLLWDVFVSLHCITY